MTEAEILARVDHCLLAAREAGKDFDILAFSVEAIPASDMRTSLSGWLGELEDSLASLSLDLSTLPYLESNDRRPRHPGKDTPRTPDKEHDRC